MKKIGYVGFSNSMIQKLINSPLYDLRSVFCDKSRLTSEILSLCTQNNIPLFPVSNKDELEQYLPNGKNMAEFFIVYKSQIIIPKTLIDEYNFYNFHCGNLATNRGAHSISWSILLGDLTTEISMHKIGDKIDTGVLISTYKVDIDRDETTSTLYTKLEEGIDYMLPQLVKYVNGEISGTIITDGIYRRKVISDDFTINLANDSREVIHRKICSQEDYEGALIKAGSVTFYCKRLLNISSNNTDLKNDFIVEGNILNVFAGEKQLTFIIDKIRGSQIISS